MQKGDFILDGGPWLGYMLAVRDDFRGVKSVEKLAGELKLDEKIAAHAEAAQELLTTWQVSASDADKFTRAVEGITGCFLYEGLPVDLVSRCRACMKKAADLDIEAADRDRFEFLQLWEQGWKDGLEAYGASASRTGTWSEVRLLRVARAHAPKRTRRGPSGYPGRAAQKQRGAPACSRSPASARE